MRLLSIAILLLVRRISLDHHSVIESSDPLGSRVRAPAVPAPSWS